MLNLGPGAPAAPLSENRVGKHWGKRRTATRPWFEKAWAVALEEKLPRKVHGRPAQVRLVIPFRTRQHRDPSNYVGTVCKAAIDGLVKARVWPNDTPEYVEVLEPRCVIGGDALVEITLKETA
jgi:hypothetical protein